MLAIQMCAVMLMLALAYGRVMAALTATGKMPLFDFLKLIAKLPAIFARMQPLINDMNLALGFATFRALSPDDKSRIEAFFEKEFGIPANTVPGRWDAGITALFQMFAAWKQLGQWWNEVNLEYKGRHEGKDYELPDAGKIAEFIANVDTIEALLPPKNDTPADLGTGGAESAPSGDAPPSI